MNSKESYEKVNEALLQPWTFSDIDETLCGLTKLLARSDGLTAEAKSWAQAECLYYMAIKDERLAEDTLKRVRARTPVVRNEAEMAQREAEKVV